MQNGLFFHPAVSVVLLVVLVVLVVLVLILVFHLRAMHGEIVALRQLSQGIDDGQSRNVGEESISFYDKGGRLVFTTHTENIIYIEAADNYTNIHYLSEGHEDTFILHNSLKEIERHYTDYGLLRCHRRYMVNVANVKLMRKEKCAFVLEMNHVGRTIPVSKSYESVLANCFSPLKL